MSFSRMFVYAISRRVACAFVLIALAFSGAEKAYARDQGEAYLECMAVTRALNRPDLPFSRCVIEGFSAYRGQRCKAENSQCYLFGLFGFDLDKTCDKRPDFVTEFYPRSGSYSCNAGCVVHFYRNDDGTSTGTFAGSLACDGPDPDGCVASGRTWNPVLHVCEPNEPECPVGQTVNSLGQCAPEPCPAGKVLGPDGTCRKRENECPAGQVRGPDGSCVDNECPAGQVRGPDGTCKRDDDDDGNEDDADEEFFSGGDDCSTPPQCSGSPILCGQARIQWRIDCNTRKNRSISGGTCGAMPVCDGEKCDALEYSMLVQQWKAACALEKLAAGGGSGGGDGDNSDVIDFLGGPGTHNPNVVGGDTLTDAGPGDDEFDIPEPDSSGYGYSRTCPTPPSVTLPNGVVVNFDLAPLCQWVSLAGSIVLILAGLVSLRIVSGGAA